MQRCVRCDGRGRLTANSVPCVRCKGSGEEPGRPEINGMPVGDLDSPAPNYFDQTKRGFRP